jgi:hypothetical protein
LGGRTLGSRLQIRCKFEFVWAFGVVGVADTSLQVVCQAPAAMDNMVEIERLVHNSKDVMDTGADNRQFHICNLWGLLVCGEKKALLSDSDAYILFIKYTV